MRAVCNVSARISSVVRGFAAGVVVWLTDGRYKLAEEEEEEFEEGFCMAKNLTEQQRLAARRGGRIKLAPYARRVTP